MTGRQTLTSTAPVRQPSAALSRIPAAFWSVSSSACVEAVLSPPQTHTRTGRRRSYRCAVWI